MPPAALCQILLSISHRELRQIPLFPAGPQLLHSLLGLNHYLAFRSKLLGARLPRQPSPALRQEERGLAARLTLAGSGPSGLGAPVLQVVSMETTPLRVSQGAVQTHAGPHLHCRGCPLKETPAYLLGPHPAVTQRRPEQCMVPASSRVTVIDAEAWESMRASPMPSKDWEAVGWGGVPSPFFLAAAPWSSWPSITSCSGQSPALRMLRVGAGLCF